MYISVQSPGGTSQGITFVKERFGVRSTTRPSDRLAKAATGVDRRYNDFERSTPVAAFAKRSDGLVVDLTPNLSFTNVIPWEVPPGDWTLMYMVEKRAEYYIDAI